MTKSHIIRLPDEYPGRQLKIELTLRDDKGITGIKYPVVSEYDALIRLLEKGSVINLMTGFFMLGFGLISLTVCVAVYIGMRLSDTKIISAVLTSIVGLWIVLNDAAGRLILPGTAAERAAIPVMVSATAFLILYVSSVPKKLKEKLVKSGFESLTSAEEILLLDIGVLGLMVIMQFIGGVFIGADVSAATVYFRRIVFFANALFIAVKAYRYSVFISEVDIQRTENEKLFDIAYADSLTGLYNRACWDEKIAELRSEEHTSELQSR